MVRTRSGGGIDTIAVAGKFVARHVFIAMNQFQRFEQF